MRSESLFRLLFVVYCLEAGLFLTWMPWSPGWERAIAQLPWPTLRPAVLSTWARGLVSAVGVVHFVWIAHDLDLARRRAGARPDDSHPAPGRDQ